MIFNPDALTDGGTWISPAPATTILDQSAGTDTGLWLVHEAWISSWTVPERAVLKAHDGSATVDVRLVN